MKKHFTILIAFFIVIGTSLAQQLPFRSNFTEASFIWNPAMTSPFDYMEFGAIYRQQWMGFEDAPRTAIAHGQIPIIDYNMSLGGFLMQDKTGPLEYNSVSLSYAYQLELGYGGDQISIGILGSLSQYRFNSHEAEVNDFDDLLLINGSATKMQPNVGVGVFYSSNSGYNYDESYFYVGLAVNQLLPLDLVFDEVNSEANFKQEIHGNATIGARFVQNYLYIEPYFWMNYAAPNLRSSIVGLRLELEERFWTGLAFGNDKNVGVQAGVILSGGLLQDGLMRIGAMANINTGTLGRSQKAGYEIYLSYRFEP